jgi:hypothetical protein
MPRVWSCNVVLVGAFGGFRRGLFLGTVVAMADDQEVLPFAAGVEWLVVVTWEWALF